MELLQFRIRAHKVLADTHWIQVKDGVNILAGEDPKAVQAVFELLQTIRPPSSAHLRPLTTNMRQSVSQNGYTKRVIPKKKTAAFAIFSADNTLVRDIASLDDALYELDRIEVGRRIDLSRWMNFVELSSSARWSEIDQPLRQLLDDLTKQCPSKILQPLKEMTALRKGTDRLHRGLDQTLIDQLTALSPVIGPAQKEMYAGLLHTAQRSQRFILAKKAIYPQVPLFIHLVDQVDGNTRLPLTLFTDLLNNNTVLRSNPTQEELNQLIQSMFAPLSSPASIALQGQTISLMDGSLSLPHLVQSLAALHQILFGRLPIFLIDCLKSSPRTIEEVLSTLQLMRGSRSLVAAKKSHLALCQPRFRHANTITDHTWQK
ncbi:hypothetical protein [Desulfogranum marinum]|uniref:hypothetical protein n=1 Tax=Desulfogranum marinum TaxID=453220 RepID=UPI001962A199|nr:hypothetical protein [Desulfogranum marinum]MBM9511866.1 hypothetical protein [Desulfogranum marinum]